MGVDINPTRPAARRALPESTRAHGRLEDALFGPVTARIYLASCVLMVVGFLMLMLAPARSYPERAGYVVAEIGWFLHLVAFCTSASSFAQHFVVRILA